MRHSDKIFQKFKGGEINMNQYDQLILKLFSLSNNSDAHYILEKDSVLAERRLCYGAYI